eukprot:m.54557 g.54557  ORF g.54557 m.54557 type:complete len:638 (+) comp11432_c0_seq2:202-2115(+)
MSARTRSAALFKAVEQGDHEAVALLVKQIGPKNVTRDMFGATPLHQAVAGGKVKVVYALLKAGMDPNDTADEPSLSFSTGLTPLHYAARAGKLMCVRALAAYHCKVNAKDAKGQTPLYLAAGSGHTDTINALLALGATLEPDNIGATPLHAACARGRISAVHALMEAGSDPTIKDQYGYSPLFWAARKGRGTSIEALTHYGVTLDYDKNGHCALDVAIRFRHTACAEVIQKCYPDAVASTTPWIESRTPLSASGHGLQRRNSAPSNSFSTMPSFVSDADEADGYMDVGEKKALKKSSSGSALRSTAVSGSSRRASMHVPQARTRTASEPLQQQSGVDEDGLPSFGDDDEATDGYIHVTEVFSTSAQQTKPPLSAEEALGFETFQGDAADEYDMLPRFAEVKNVDGGYVAFKEEKTKKGLRTKKEAVLDYDFPTYDSQEQFGFGGGEGDEDEEEGGEELDEHYIEVDDPSQQQQKPKQSCKPRKNDKEQATTSVPTPLHSAGDGDQEEDAYIEVKDDKRAIKQREKEQREAQKREKGKQVAQAKADAKVLAQAKSKAKSTPDTGDPDDGYLVVKKTKPTKQKEKPAGGGFQLSAAAKKRRDVKESGSPASSAIIEGSQAPISNPFQLSSAAKKRRDGK